MIYGHMPKCSQVAGGIAKKKYCFLVYMHHLLSAADICETVSGYGQTLQFYLRSPTLKKTTEL